MLFFRKKAAQSAKYIWLVTGAVLLLKALFIFGTPLRGLMSTSWLIDDSFIEMRIAKNIALGGGFTLDGVHATTGAPFLWIYLTSLNHLFSTTETAIRMTLLMSSFFGALSCMVVFFLAQKLTEDRRIAWTAFLLATFTANAFCNALNGMDTAFFTFLVLMSIASFFGVGRPERWSGFAWGCVIGLWMGLTVMTRGDGLFVIFAMLCIKAWQWKKAAGDKRKEETNMLLGMLLISGLCFAFFMGWQLIQTGSPFPGNQVGRRQLALDWQNFSFDDFSLSRYVNIVVWNVFQLEDLFGIAMGSSLLALTALVLGCLQKRLRELGILCVIYFGIFFTLLVTYQWYFANLHGLRYINPAVHLLFIFTASMLWQLPTETWKKSAVVVLACSILVLANYRHYQMSSRFPWTKYMSYIGRPDPVQNKIFWGPIDWIKTNLPPKTLIGVRDYGRISIFTDVNIQDIAGNIDPDAAVALKNGTLDAYLKEKQVHYLLMPTLEARPDKLYQYIYSHLRLERVKGAPSFDMQNLYRIL